MSKNQVSDLNKFLEPFDQNKREIIHWLRAFIWDLYPDTNELIYDNYNALALGWSPTEKVGHTFCSLALGRTSGNIHFGFYWGSQISDPGKMLLGQGNQYRYILVGNINEFPADYIKKLMTEAYSYSLAKVKDLSQIRKGLTITKSISASKRTKKKQIK